MLIGPQVVQTVVEVAHLLLVIDAVYQNHAVDANPLADAHSAKLFWESVQNLQ
jgi:hypothetical protein